MPPRQKPLNPAPRPATGNAPDLAIAAIRPLAETTQALRATVEEETAALRRSDFVAFARIQTAKMDRMKSWHEAVVAFQKHREELSGVSADLRARLETLRTDLSRAFEENLAAIARANRSVSRLHGRIMTIARREVEDRNRVTYSKTGGAGTNRKKAVSMGIVETA